MSIDWKRGSCRFLHPNDLFQPTFQLFQYIRSADKNIFWCFSLRKNYFDQFLLITKTYFSQSRSEQFSKQNVYCCCKFDAKIFGNNNHQQKLGRWLGCSRYINTLKAKQNSSQRITINRKDCLIYKKGNFRGVFFIKWEVLQNFTECTLSDVFA